MKLDEQTREALSKATVDVLMDARRMALQRGTSPLKLWDQLQSRMRAAARTCASPAEWSTKLLRDLQIAAPSKALSHSIHRLQSETAGRERAWLDLVEREHGYLIALARLEADRRKTEREAIEEEWAPLTGGK